MKPAARNADRSISDFAPSSAGQDSATTSHSLFCAHLTQPSLNYKISGTKSIAEIPGQGVNGLPPSERSAIAPTEILEQAGSSHWNKQGTILVLSSLVLSEVYGHNYGGRDTRGWFRLIIPLWKPASQTPLITKG
jgi:hypothetical protein